MAVKMRKWSPWPPARKFAVAVRLMRLEVLAEDGGSGAAAEKTLAIRIKWKGVPKIFPLIPPFQARRKIEESSHKVMKKNCGIIEWEEDLWFENTCCFSIVSDQKFGPWEITFNVLCGEKVDSKAKTAAIGGVSVNISEIVGKIGTCSIEQKLPLIVQIDGIAREAYLTVMFNFVEIRESQDSTAATDRTKSVDIKHSFVDECKDNGKARRRSLSLEEVCLDDSDESKSRVSTTVPESDRKDRWFAWKSRRFSFKRARTKDEKVENCGDESKIDGQVRSADKPSGESFNECFLQKDDTTKSSSESSDKGNTIHLWEEKDVISRDGKSKLKAPFFFASFDQRSDKAAGASACTALVAVISHWLHTNVDSMPSRLEFEDLIMRGSSEWRKLCEDANYVRDFPNKHFDLETVLRADIRPVTISHNESFVGFFGADAFDSLKGAMSFDEIWDEISSNDHETAPRIYIVSWNDHFFVMKAEANAYYIIDTLGERLYEGCTQAYIIRFDDEAVMKNYAGKEKEVKTSENEIEEDEVICSGKECCREFIKRFLAAISLKELEEEENKKKKAVSYFCLHQRLQIEFNYSCLISRASSSSTSSPLSSLTTSASSPFTD